MRKDYINVLIKKPGLPPHFATVRNELPYLQAVVGGYIECFPIATGCVIICNEEGKLMHLPHNCNICGEDFVGTIMLVGVDGEEFTDFPLTLEGARQTLANLWEVS